MQYVELRTNRGPQFIDNFFFVELLRKLRNHYRRKVQVPHLFKQQLKLRVQMNKYGVTCRLTQPKTKNPNKRVDHEQVRCDPSFCETPEWLQEFIENLVDEESP